MYCLSEFCRICINKNEQLTNLHSPDTDLVTFYEKLKYCNSEVMSEGTDLLEFICTKCTNNLRKTYDFLRLVRTTEDVLRNYVKTLENTVKGGESLAGLMERNYKELKIIYPMEGDFDAVNNDRFVYDERSGIEIIKLQPVCENDVVRVKDEKELKEERNEIVSVDVTNTNTLDLLVERRRPGRPRKVEIVDHPQINNFNTADFYTVNARPVKQVPNELLTVASPPEEDPAPDGRKEHKLIYLPSRFMNKDTRRKCRWCYKKRSHLWGREWAMKCKKVCTMCEACGIFLCPPCFDDLHADVT